MPKKPTQKTTPTPTTTVQPVNLKKIKAKIDPEILAIRAKAREEIKRLQDTRCSGRRLEAILKMIPRLDPDDVNRLRNYLNQKDKPFPVIPGEGESKAIESATASEGALAPQPEASTDPWSGMWE